MLPLVAQLVLLLVPQRLQRTLLLVLLPPLATLPRLPLTLPRLLLTLLPRSNRTARVHPAVDTKSHRKVAFLLGAGLVPHPSNGCEAAWGVFYFRP